MCAELGLHGFEQYFELKRVERAERTPLCSFVRFDGESMAERLFACDECHINGAQLFVCLYVYIDVNLLACDAFTVCTCLRAFVRVCVASSISCLWCSSFNNQQLYVKLVEMCVTMDIVFDQLRKMTAMKVVFAAADLDFAFVQVCIFCFFIYLIIWIVVCAFVSIFCDLCVVFGLWIYLICLLFKICFVFIFVLFDMCCFRL